MKQPKRLLEIKGEKKRVIVDAEDYDRISVFRWQKYKVNTSAKTGKTYFYIGRQEKKGANRIVRLAHVILGVENREENKNQRLVYLNGNAFDLRKTNLKISSINTGFIKPSIYLLNDKHRKLKPWGLCLSFKQRTIPITSFATKELAKAAADKIPTEVLYVGDCQTFEDYKKKVYEWKGVVYRNYSRNRNGEIINSYGQIMIPNPNRKGSYIRKHVKIWEDANGAIPQGYSIKFKDGNYLNCTLENFELISNSDLQYQKYYRNCAEEVKPAIDALIELKKIIRERKPPSNRKVLTVPKGGNWWTTEENEYLKKHYLSLTARQLGEAIGRSEEAVSNQLRKLNLFKKLHNLGESDSYRVGLDWSEKEDRLLKDWYLSVRAENIAKALGRTRDGVVSRAKKLGIKHYERRNHLFRGVENYAKPQN